MIRQRTTDGISGNTDRCATIGQHEPDPSPGSRGSIGRNAAPDFTTPHTATTDSSDAHRHRHNVAGTHTPADQTPRHSVRRGLNPTYRVPARRTPLPHGSDPRPVPPRPPITSPAQFHRAHPHLINVAAASSSSTIVMSPTMVSGSAMTALQHPLPHVDDPVNGGLVEQRRRIENPTRNPPPTPQHRQSNPPWRPHHPDRPPDPNPNFTKRATGSHPVQ